MVGAGCEGAVDSVGQAWVKQREVWARQREAWVRERHRQERGVGEGDRGVGERVGEAALRGWPLCEGNKRVAVWGQWTDSTRARDWATRNVWLHEALATQGWKQGTGSGATGADCMRAREEDWLHDGKQLAAQGQGWQDKCSWLRD